MPRPTSKAQLLEDITRERAALDQFLSGLSPEQMTQSGWLGDWSVKDVLAHLTEWQRMVLSWHAAGLRGETPAIPAPGYNWAQIPALNQVIYETYRATSLDDILAAYHDYHRQMLELVQNTPEEELFTPGCHAWTRKLTFAAYVTSATGSHDRWARTELRKALKARAAK